MEGRLYRTLSRFGPPPSSLTLPQGGAGNTTCTVTSQVGFNSAVDLSCSGQPAGVSCSFAPDPVTPPADGSAASALTVSVSGAATPGTFNFGVLGAGGALNHSAPLSLTVQAVCQPPGGSCTVTSQCCSGTCKGKAGAKTCR